jgi:hypothetical protein
MDDFRRLDWGSRIDSEKRLRLVQVSLRPFLEHWGQKVVLGALKYVISMGYTTPYGSADGEARLTFFSFS